jgi:cytochrome c peroxidase
MACGVRRRADGPARLLAALLLAAPLVSAQHLHEPPKALAPGYAPLAFPLPAAGSYQLPPLWDAGDGAVVDADARAQRLHELLGDRYVVLSFIFTRCSDVNGCPLATYVLKGLQDRLKTDRLLAGRVRLLSLSFDPAHDTPDVLKSYAARVKDADFDWRFLTTRGEPELEPILRAYDQTIMRDYDADGRELGTISHLLRVYLIDRQRRIRNVYSVNFLHADTVANDILTLLAEDRLQTSP